MMSTRTLQRMALVAMLLSAAMLFLGVRAEEASSVNETAPEEDSVLDASKITFPNILAQKRILSNDIVVGDRVEVEISLYNIGSVAAQDIVIEENEWDPAITIENGENKHHVARLGVYESVKINYYLRVPSEEGDFRGGPAKIMYRREDPPVDNVDEEGTVELDETLTPQDSKVHVSYSTQIYEDAELPYDRMNREETSVRSTNGNAVTVTAGKLRVLSQKAFNQRHAHHVKEVMLFLVLLLVPIGLPYYFYYIRSKELELALSRAAASPSSKKAN